MLNVSAGLPSTPCCPQPCAGNLTAWASTVAAGPTAQGFAPREVAAGTPIHDEPGIAFPASVPPVASKPAVRARWEGYLQVICHRAPWPEWRELAQRSD